LITFPWAGTYLGPDYTSPSTRLYDAFVEATGIRIARNTFADRLLRKGLRNRNAKGKELRVTSGPYKGRTCWRGVRLLADVEAERARRVVEEMLARVERGDSEDT
jgi:hypothetical protein